MIVLTQLPVTTGPFAGGQGFIVFMLNHQGDKTVVNIIMEHERLTQDLSEDEAIVIWKSAAPENLLKWRDYFIPTLRSWLR